MPTHQLRVLVGTADVELCQVLSSLLELEGHVCVPAADARTAYKVLLTRAPNAVILDVSLGDTGGIEVARAVRRSPGADRIWTVLLTSEVMGTTVAMDDPHVLILPKPIDVVELTGRLRDFALSLPPPIPIPSRRARPRVPPPSPEKWALLGIKEGADTDDVESAADIILQSLTREAQIARSLAERTAISQTAARVRAARTELLRHLMTSS